MKRHKEPEWYSTLNRDHANRQADRELSILPFVLIAILSIGTIAVRATFLSEPTTVEQTK